MAVLVQYSRIGMFRRILFGREMPVAGQEECLTPAFFTDKIGDNNHDGIEGLGSLWSVRGL